MHEGFTGGIFGLLDLIDEFEEAIEYDLIVLGLRLRWLGTSWLPWSDLWAIVKQSPLTSALNRARFGEDAGWGLTEQLLASAVDTLNVANWQRAEGKRADYPRPIPRPGTKDDNTTYGKGPLPYDEMKNWLGWSAN